MPSACLSSVMLLWLCFFFWHQRRFRKLALQIRIDLAKQLGLRADARLRELSTAGYILVEWQAILILNTFMDTIINVRYWHRSDRVILQWLASGAITEILDTWMAKKADPVVSRCSQDILISFRSTCWLLRIRVGAHLPISASMSQAAN